MPMSDILAFMHAVNMGNSHAYVRHTGVHACSQHGQLAYQYRTVCIHLAPTYIHLTCAYMCHCYEAVYKWDI